MSRKSIQTVKFLCGVSILALAGIGCFAVEAAEAGRVNKVGGFSIKQTPIPQAAVIRRHSVTNGWAARQPSVQKGRLTPMKLHTARQLNKTAASRLTRVGQDRTAGVVSEGGNGALVPIPTNQPRAKLRTLSGDRRLNKIKVGGTSKPRTIRTKVTEGIGLATAAKTPGSGGACYPEDGVCEPPQ